MVYQVKILFNKKTIHIHFAESRGIMIDQHLISIGLLNKKVMVTGGRYRVIITDSQNFKI